ncbi:MAG: TraB/GumN family protein [Deinococcales bacterium]
MNTVKEIMEDTPAIEVMPETSNDKQPLEIVEKGGVTFTILGTAHVSKSSAEAVEKLLSEEDFDAVAIELDENRYNAITNPNRFAELDLLKVIREGKAGMVAASLALGSFQQRIAEQFGIEPGAEMRTAIRCAEEKHLPILLIDRDIGITLRRVYANVPWWQRMNIFAGLIASVLSREEIKEEDIEKLKEGDMLESTFREFSEQSQHIFSPLISERDTYMSLRLQEEVSQREHEDFDKVLVVIGAGHLKGLVEHLKTGSEGKGDKTEVTLARQGLEHVPQSSNWWKIIPWIIMVIILAGFVIGFSRNTDLGWAIVKDWVLVNGSLAALGAIIAMAHPLTVIGSFIAAPITSLNPLIGAGYVGAGLELWLRHPTVNDFQNLRQDVTTWRGWWKNRVSRTLLVFILVTLGSALGTWVAGFSIVNKLLH